MTPWEVNVRPLISTDFHIATPPSLLDGLPDTIKDQFQHLEHRADGTYLVGPTAGAMSAMAGLVPPVKVDDEAQLARLAMRNVCDEANPGFRPEDQLADMAREGIEAAVLIGRFPVFASTETLDAEIAYCRVVNDWLADTYRDHLHHFAPAIHLPFNDVDASVRELERAAGMGLRPALLPDGIYERPYFYDEWEPLWEAADALRVPFTMHVGGLRAKLNPDPRAIAFPGYAQTGWYLMCAGMAETLSWFAYSGLFEKYPNLTVVMTEGYAGWLGFAVQFFDHHWDGRFEKLSFTPKRKLDAPPGYYIRRQAKATFMWDPIAINNREFTGTDCLLWGNDYPHQEGAFPHSQEWVEKQFAGVPDDEIDRMVRRNAAEVFGFTL
jgi:predicted TIM-barrel fold metal-dependent hydrolase